MSDRIMLKLGGSVITDKSGDCRIDYQRLAIIAESIALAGSNGLLVVHGAGSCGHPEAMRYSLHKGIPPRKAEGIFITHQSVSQLNAAVVAALRKQGIEAIGIHPYHAAYADNGKLVFLEHRHLDRMMVLGVIPVIHGDVVIDHTRGISIISGDQLVRYLAPRLGIHRLGLATDVPGVLDGGIVVPVITPESAPTFQIGNSSNTDVTGGMRGKINELLELVQTGTEAEIFHVSRISDFLSGKECGGTKVRARG